MGNGMAVLNIKKILQIGWILILTLWLVACANEKDNRTGILTLSIIDAPVDGAEQVVVEFTGLTIQGASGRTEIDYALPRTIDLLALQGGLRATLLESLELDAGHYSWIRLKVNAVADGVMDSYIRISGADYELNIPSGSQTGLRLSTPFDIVDGEILDFTIDFDLRKSVHQPNGQTYMGAPVYFLRPTLRLIDTNESGVISGRIDPLVVYNGLTCSAPDAGYGVYLFDGNVSPDDIDGVNPDPVTTVMATLDAASNYVYTMAFIMPGNYTIASTCVADLDEPDMNDAGVVFVGEAPVSVTAGATTPHDF